MPASAKGTKKKAVTLQRRGSHPPVGRRRGLRNVRAHGKAKTGSGRGVKTPAGDRGLVGLAHGAGCAAVVRVGERIGRVRDEVGHRFVVTFGAGSSAGAGFIGRHIGVLRRVCRVLGALGHLQRGKILLRLLESPATYQALRRVTGLKAGPLYHHVNQLRLAGLALPKQRDLYELTRAGRNLIVAAMALEGLTRDGRRRPV